MNPDKDALEGNSGISDRGSSSPEQATAGDSAPRKFSACVFCAMMLWSEMLSGPNSFMKNPRAVAEKLSADRYHENWVRIPIEKLYASSVDFPPPR